MKKGVSAVVATVLIILITVAAVTIIWSAIIPMIRDNLVGGDDCMKAQSEISIGMNGYTCINGNNISLQVMHGPSDFKLAEVQVIVHTGGDSYSQTLAGSNFGGEMPGKNQAKIAYLVNASYAGASKIDIAPIVTVGATKKTCAVAQSVDLINCTA